MIFAASRLKASVALLAAIAAAGCGTPPKPPELDAFERLRADPSMNAANKKAPDLVKGADRLLKQSQEDWHDNDLKESRNAALLGHIKLKHALALAEQEDARKRMAEADGQLDEAEEEQARLGKDLAAVSEQVALLRRLTEAAVDKQRLVTELAEHQKRSAEEAGREKAKDGAQEKIADAERALFAADKVKAGDFAAVPYGAAKDMLARARQELAQANFRAAETSAEFARGKAQESEATARPTYEKEARSAESKAAAESLERESTAIPGIKVYRDQRGSLLRIVLPIPADMLFHRREVTVAPGRDALLDPIAAIMKKYPTFPVQVVGYSDTRGKQGELLALSLARAQSVLSGLVTRGADMKRMVVSGQGGAEPISDNKTPGGRAANNRIEVVFIYQ